MIFYRFRIIYGGAVHNIHLPKSLGEQLFWIQEPEINKMYNLMVKKGKNGAWQKVRGVFTGETEKTDYTISREDRNLKVETWYIEPCVTEAAEWKVA